MNEKLENVLKQIDGQIQSLVDAKKVIANRSAQFEIALTIGGVSATDQNIYLHPKGSSREYLSLFEGCTFTRHSYDGAIYHWVTELDGCQMKVLCNEAVANANGTVVMP